MGAEDSQKKGFFSTKATFKNRSTIFTLGSRDTVLTTELEDPIIVIPHAQKAERKVRGGREGGRQWTPRDKCVVCLPCSTPMRLCSAAYTLPSWTTLVESTFLLWSSSTSHQPLHRTSLTPSLARHWPTSWSVSSSKCLIQYLPLSPPPLQKHVEGYVENCYDAIGLFLCIHINYRFEAIMTRRGVPCLQE